jgi:anhydro-N-acetylmuramic acid kinase
VIVTGVISGTSADGINVALIRIFGQGFNTRFTLLAHAEYAYPAAVRKAVLAAMNAQAASVADLARLNVRLGELYAQAVKATARRHRLRPDLVGCHGQTIYHQGEARSFLGAKLAVTWQTGEGAIVAARVGVPVVSDFRPADMAAGGKGAPLVPFLDYIVYRHRTRGRILQNLGGIGNLTAIPARANIDEVIAFDTGPGNMVIDACAQALSGRSYDKDGKIAAMGKPVREVIDRLLKDEFFRQRPPKTAGREEFGREYVARFRKLCGRAAKQDVIATATALTAKSIGLALRRFVFTGAKYHDYVVAGGGAKNPTLLRMIADELKPLRLELRHSDEFGVPAEAKEAIAFAVLAYQTWRRKPGNVPSATGAKRPAILGKVSYA